jgi:hypothetical protein
MSAGISVPRRFGIAEGAMLRDQPMRHVSYGSIPLKNSAAVKLPA